MEEFERNHRDLALQVALLPILRAEAIRVRVSYHAGLGGNVYECECAVEACIKSIKQLVEKM